MAMTQIALWARTDELTIADVEESLWKSRTIVKSRTLRGALHLHRSSELLVYLAGFIRRRLPYEQRWITRRGLDEKEVNALVYDALEGGPLTRLQLATKLAKHLGKMTARWATGGWGHRQVGPSTAWVLVMPGIARGLVCFGPSQGQEITFVRTDQWLPKPGPMPVGEEAEESLLRRYFHSYGPATVRDFCAWAYLPVSYIKPALERLGSELTVVDVDGHEAFLLREDLPRLKSAKIDRVIRLLPSFDPFMLGHRDKGHLVDRTHYKKVYREAGWLAPVILMDGRVIGTWSYERKGRKLDVECRMFASASSNVRKAVEEEAQDLSRFLEAPSLDLRFQ